MYREREEPRPAYEITKLLFSRTYAKKLAKRIGYIYIYSFTHTRNSWELIYEIYIIDREKYHSHPAAASIYPDIEITLHAAVYDSAIVRRSGPLGITHRENLLL